MPCLDSPSYQPSNSAGSSSESSAEEAIPQETARINPEDTGIVVMYSGMFGVNKKYPCGYCPELCLCSRIQEHFRNEHGSLSQVKECLDLMAVDLNTGVEQAIRREAYDKRRKIETLLLNTSTYIHNKRVLNDGKGLLCPVRLPTKIEAETMKSSAFAFCTMCNGLYKRGRNIRDHCLNSCSQRSDSATNNQKELKASSRRVALELPSNVSDQMISLLSSMREDETAKNVRKDGLILYIGQLFLERDETNSVHSHVRERMRKLADLVTKMRVKDLSTVIDPTNWILLCDTVRREYAPTAQLKLGIYVKRAAELLENIVIQSDSPIVPRNQIKDFHHLLETEWKHRVGHQALMASEQKKNRSVDLLPVSRDVHIVRDHLDKEVIECLKNYKEGNGDPVRSKKILGCKATVFNKRRGMEFIKSPKQEILDEVKRMTDNPPGDVSEFSEHLSDVEKALSAKMNLIRVVGKQGKIVPVLMEDTDHELLLYILKDPACDKDTFLFQNSRNQPYRGHSLLAALTTELTLERPAAIR